MSRNTHGGRRTALVSAFAIACTLAFGSVAADAAGSGGRAPHGDHARHTERTRTTNGRERHDEVTNARGKTATRDATVTRDREHGTRTKEVVATGPNGGTRTLSDERQRTDGGFTRSTDVTRANGSTLSRDVMVSRDPETHSVSKDVTVDREQAPTP